MKKPQSYGLKVINLIECLEYLNEIEAKEKGTECLRGCRTYKNGEVTIERRLWTLIIKDQYGNQKFSNDSFYRWTDIADDTDNPDIQTFLKYFKDAVNEGEYDDENFVLFEVCW